MRKFKSFKKNKSCLLIKKILFWGLSFGLPALSFFIYFACHHFNILTVDLGQQYIDFFAFFRRNLFTHPLSLIYSFQNGLGASMLATDAYYLLSPFNLLIFLFPQKELAVAILLVISLKIGTIGLSSYYYWQEKGACFFALAASTAYALSGYVIAYHFNLMWLDAVILLPLLIKALDQLIEGQPNHLFLLTFLLELSNFYTGLMALFFGFLYLLTHLYQIKSKERLALLLAYFKRSCAGCFSAAFILLPVFLELLASKAGGSPNWNFSWQFNPLLELTKLIPGAYNFQQMQTGMPNIYFTLPFTLLTILYFLNGQITWKDKLAKGLLLLFLLLSLSFTPLVLFWHLGQFPIWYPGRFSFVLIFYCLDLAIEYLRQETKISGWQKAVLALVGLGLIAYCYANQKKFAFLNKTALTITTLFMVLILLYFIFSYNLRGSSYLFCLITIIEAISSMLLCLNNLSYQQNRDYQNFAQNMTQASQSLKQNDPTLYRSEKTFYRSDDDPFTGNYYGLTSFNSTTNQQTLGFLSKLGYLHNSNSVTNNGGTPLSDAFLGVKYYFVPRYPNRAPAKLRMKYDNLNGRLDVFNYEPVRNFQQLSVLKAKNSLPLLYLTTSPQANLPLDPSTPLQNQQNLIKQALNSRTDYITHLAWPKPSLTACRHFKNSRTFISFASRHQSKVSFTLPLKTKESYYLELPAGLEENQMALDVNQQAKDLTVRDSQNHLLNLAFNAKGTKLTLTFILRNKQLDLNGADLWLLKITKLNRDLRRFKQDQPRFYQPRALELTSSKFRTKKKTRLASTIPASYNWLIFDRGHLLKQEKYNQTFLSVKLTPGKHQIKLVYLPFAFLIGLLISLITLFLVKKYWH